MEVLIVGLNYAPEPIGIGSCTTGLAEYLAQRGHRVEVVAGRPYYPQWRAYPGFRNFGWRLSDEAGVSITRCWHYVPRVPGGAKRILHHLTFALSALPAVSWRAVRDRPDVVFCIAPSIMSAFPAKLGAWFGGAKMWLQVQDFEVDAAFATGMVKVRASGWPRPEHECGVVPRCESPTDRQRGEREQPGQQHIGLGIAIGLEAGEIPNMARGIESPRTVGAAGELRRNRPPQKAAPSKLSRPKRICDCAARRGEGGGQ